MENIFIINETTSINDIINYLRGEKINFSVGNDYLLHAGTINGEGIRNYLDKSGNNEFHIGKTNLGNFINSISGPESPQFSITLLISFRENM